MDSLIKKYEGCHLRAYLDPRGIATIGWGSIWFDGRRVNMGDSITQEKADNMLVEYLNKEVSPILDNLPKYITESQKIALASLIYNWNAQGFKNSQLYKAIMTKNRPEIWKQWDFGIKNDLGGIFKRRAEELFLFMQDIDKW